SHIIDVIECKTFEDLLATTQPLEEYLANAGCLRPLRRLEDKNLLVDDILMFQVLHRVRGPFERFRDGLRTLGVLDKIKGHPESFRPLLCWSPTMLTADLVDSLFTINLKNNKALYLVIVHKLRVVMHDTATPSKLPIANTCINCLKLPLHTSYRAFQENMDFALGNTHDKEDNSSYISGGGHL
uniref:HECT domain-containing protein n=1 Tax=Dicentrarchus labrax TaxID=13489 RepID=A0A8C4HDA7_DICLA